MDDDYLQAYTSQYIIYIYMYMYHIFIYIYIHRIPIYIYMFMIMYTFRCVSFSVKEIPIHKPNRMTTLPGLERRWNHVRIYGRTIQVSELFVFLPRSFATSRRLIKAILDHDDFFWGNWLGLCSWISIAIMTISAPINIYVRITVSNMEGPIHFLCACFMC